MSPRFPASRSPPVGQSLATLTRQGFHPGYPIDERSLEPGVRMAAAETASSETFVSRVTRT
jgi:hypothetical protein